MSTTDLIDVDGRPALRLERRLAYPVARVWRAISVPDELARWFVVPVAWGPTQGETLESFGAVVTVTEVEPERTLAWTWADEAYRFDLRPEGADATVLVFTHVFADRAVGAQHAAGWDVYLERLDVALAGGALDEEAAHGPIAELHERHAAAFGLDPARGRRTIAGMAFRDPTLHDAPGGGVTLRLERRFRAPVERVWRAVADPQERARWFPVDAAPLEVAETDEPHLLVGTWFGDELRFELHADGTGTRLVFTHAFADREVAARTGAGWDRSFARFEALLAGVVLDGRTSLELWPDVHERLAAAYGVDPQIGRSAFAAHPLT